MSRPHLRRQIVAVCHWRIVRQCLSPGDRRQRACPRFRMMVSRPCLLLAAGLLLCLTACGFNEKPWPMRPQDRVQTSAPAPAERREMAGSTRKWLATTHKQIEHLLTQRGRRVLLTDDMVDADGRARDVYQYFDRNPDTLNSLRYNWYGLLHTAQAAGRAPVITEPMEPWPGFQQVWIPVAKDVQLSGWLGFAEKNGQVRQADCIVLLPGFFGDNAVTRTDYVSHALRAAGYHVLAIELRGHGHTELRYPDVYYNFGVIEMQDMIKVDEWLQNNYPQIDRTGMLSFCWGANLAMLTAWYDGRRPDDPSLTESVRRHLEPLSPRRHYTAGALAFAPSLDWEQIMDRADVPHKMLVEPATYFFQQFVRDRMIRKGYPNPDGSLRRLIDLEFAHSFLGPCFPIAEAYQSLRLLPYRGLPDNDKLEYARVPVLIVSSINDPFLSAQETADLIARTSNPRVAALILRGGGHIGFAPYNRSYFYSLITNFFDPKTGAAACIGDGGTGR
jgi:predicted alpha/beta-fold hydrolase